MRDKALLCNASILALQLPASDRSSPRFEPSHSRNNVNWTTSVLPASNAASQYAR